MAEIEKIIDAKLEETEEIIKAKLEEKQKKEWPKGGDEYYFAIAGEVTDGEWDGGKLDIDRLAMGNCWRTEEEADAYKLRVESLKPKFLPKEGEKYWSIYSDWVDVTRCVWEYDNIDRVSYNLGERSTRILGEISEGLDVYEGRI